MKDEYKIIADESFNVDDLTPVAEIYLQVAESALRMANRYKYSGDGYDITNGPLTIECTVQKNKDNLGIKLGWEWKSFEYEGKE